MRCRSCRRPLTSPVSIKYGFGPDCLKHAQASGSLPIEALTELRDEQRARRKRRPKASKPARDKPNETGDLFGQLIDAALDDMHRSAEIARSLGAVVNIEIIKP